MAAHPNSRARTSATYHSSAAEGADAGVAQPVGAAADPRHQAGVDQEAEIARGDGAARVARQQAQAKRRAVLQDVAQEEAIGIVAQQRAVSLPCGPKAWHEERRRVALALPEEPAAAERGAHGARAGVERDGWLGGPLGAHGVFR